MRAASRLALIASLTTGLGLAAVPAAQAATDTTAPVITGLVVSPGRVDVSRGDADITVTARVSDAGGLAEIATSARTGLDTVWNRVAQPTSPTRTTFVGTVTLVPGMASGPARVAIVATDRAGNRREVHATVDVTAGPLDVAAPTATCTVSATRVDVTSAPAAVTVTLRAQDPAGVYSTHIGGVPVAQTPASGTSVTATRTVTYPAHSPARTDTILASARDRLGNMTTVPCPTVTVHRDATKRTRLAGRDRYETAAAVALATEKPGGQVLYVASGETYPDALAASSARDGDLGVLLTRAGSLPAATRDALARLRPQRIVVVGGPTVVGEAVAAELRRYATATTNAVTRVAGQDRYETAALVARRSAPTGRPLYLASGEGFADALAAAGNRGDASVLLARPGGLGASTLAAISALAPSRVVLAGGGWAPGVCAAVTRATGVVPCELRAGADRYGTGSLFVPARPSGRVYLVGGESFPDALAIASHADGHPVYLTRPGALPSFMLPRLSHNAITEVVAVGGPAAVSAAVHEQAARLTETTYQP